MVRRLTRAWDGLRAETGFTLIELIVTMALMLVVLTAVSATFVSGTHSETVVSNRIRAESDARQALTKMRDDLHCSFAITSVNQNSLGGFTLTMTEFYNTCKAVDENPGSGSKVLLSWCTIPSPTNPSVFNLYRENTTCDTTGTRVVASDIVAPATGWPQNTAATGVGGTGTPDELEREHLADLADVPARLPADAVGRPDGEPRLREGPGHQVRAQGQHRAAQLDPLRHRVGDPAGPTLTRHGAVVGSRRERRSPRRQPSRAARTRPRRSPGSTGSSRRLPTDCTTGGTAVGTASTAGDGTYTSSLSYTPTTAGDHIWWYAELPADSNNIAVTSTCGAGCR